MMSDRLYSPSFKLFACFATLLFCFDWSVWANEPTPSADQIFVAPRELMIFKTGVEKVWGQSVVAVMNQGAEPKSFRFRMTMPEKVTDFSILEGATSEEVFLADDGIYIEKSFNPGVNVVALNFSQGAPSGGVDVTLNLARDLPEFIVMTPAQLLTVASSELKAEGFESQQGERYQVFGLVKPMKQGDVIKMRLGGVPEGRQKLWYLASISFISLVAIAIFMARRHLA